MNGHLPRRFTRDEQILGGQRGSAALRDRCRRERVERDRAILQLVRHGGGAKETVEVYGMYIQVCAERGWPIVSYRRFSQYLESLEQRGLVRRTVIVGEGHWGSLSFVEIAAGSV